MKSIVELIKLLTKFAISFCGLILCISGVTFVYAYVETTTSSKIIASVVGFILMIFLFKFGGKAMNKIDRSTFLKERDMDDYERALMRSAWGEIAGFCLVALCYGVGILGALSFVLPDSLVENIWDGGYIWRLSLTIGIGAPVGIMINSEMRDTLKKYLN
jgi:hypothetical protein